MACDLSLGALLARAVKFTPGLLVLCAASAEAQTPLDAGALRQQIERERETALPPRAAPETFTSSGAAKADGKVTVEVKEFRFRGNTLLSNEELSAAVQPYANRRLSFAELQEVAAAVGDAYRAKGWVVRAYLPNQDIRGGIVIIQVNEARFGTTKVEGDKDVWLQESNVVKRVSLQQEEGKFLNSDRLDRALLLLDDLPGVSASGRLLPGAKEGETDIALKLVQEAFITGMAMADNGGARATGEERLHGYAQLASPFGIGDQTSMYLLYSQGMQFAQLSETVPVGNDGWRVGANVSYMHYRLVPDEFDSLDGKGNSSSAGLTATYPIIRARQANLYFDAAYDWRSFLNEAAGGTASDYDTHSVRAELRGNIFDSFAGGGSNSASLALVSGTADLGTLNTSEDRAVDGGYNKLLYSLARIQTITDTVSFYGGITGQVSRDRKLDSSEMFYLGGPDGVRAYPVSEAGGINGRRFDVELRWQATPAIQATTFYNYGYVQNYGAAKDYGLEGAGLSLAWQSTSGFRAEATYAHRIGDNPNKAANGDDQDGSKIENRFWLSLSQRF